jgi:hypothetical protein
VNQISTTSCESGWSSVPAASGTTDARYSSMMKAWSPTGHQQTMPQHDSSAQLAPTNKHPDNPKFNQPCHIPSNNYQVGRDE